MAPKAVFVLALAAESFAVDTDLLAVVVLWFIPCCCVLCFRYIILWGVAVVELFKCTGIMTEWSVVNLAYIMLCLDPEQHKCTGSSCVWKCTEIPSEAYSLLSIFSNSQANLHLFWGKTVTCDAAVMSL